ncbi:MAG: hypothetical protein EOP39_22655 [Rubrivivax sp.]|nr:MAG: hypothetical protein EOP39_22655 [Rubrivivax sp.]
MVSEDDWVAACAHRLHKRWRSIEPEDLEAVAQSLWRDAHMRTMTPAAAAEQWLDPVGPNGERAPF